MGYNTAGSKAPRQVQTELTRIVAMLMILALHYLSKTGILPQYFPVTGGLFTVLSGATAYLLEAFCLVAVNVYVLITGYHMSDQRSGFRSGEAAKWSVSLPYRRIVRLWVQVFTYSAGIGAIVFLTGIVSFRDWTIYRSMTHLFPIVTGHYWFATIYIVLLLIVPLMNPALASMKTIDLQKVVAVFLLFTSIAKTVLPMQLGTDGRGIDILWFICLYLTGVLLRRMTTEASQANNSANSAEVSTIDNIFGKLGRIFIGFIRSKKAGIFLYLGGVLATYLFTAAIAILNQWTGLLPDLRNTAYSYNHLLCYVASIGLFLALQQVKIKEGKSAAVIRILGGTTFGVYLIHEHEAIRYLWPRWFGSALLTEGVWKNTLLWIPHLLISVTIMFCICAGIEYARGMITERVGNWIHEHGKHSKRD